MSLISILSPIFTNCHQNKVTNIYGAPIEIYRFFQSKDATTSLKKEDATNKIIFRDGKKLMQAPD